MQSRKMENLVPCVFFYYKFGNPLCWLSVVFKNLKTGQAVEESIRQWIGVRNCKN